MEPPLVRGPWRGSIAKPSFGPTASARVSRSFAFTHSLGPVAFAGLLLKLLQATHFVRQQATISLLPGTWVDCPIPALRQISATVAILKKVVEMVGAVKAQKPQRVGAKRRGQAAEALSLPEGAFNAQASGNESNNNSDIMDVNGSRAKAAKVAWSSPGRDGESAVRDRPDIRVSRVARAPQSSPPDLPAPGGKPAACDKAPPV